MASTLTGLLQALHIVPTAPVTPIRKTSTVNKTPKPHLNIFPPQTTDNIAGLPNGLPIISLNEVAHHDTFDDCWIVIYDRVYDVTDFMDSHPGGEDVIMDHAGRDATLAFHGTGHSKGAIKQLNDYLIGELPIKERIFRCDHGRVLSSGIPE